MTRLGPATGFPAVASEAEIGRGSTAAARAWARTIATTLDDAGVDLNFAPVVDLDVNPKSPAIGALDRSFSADPAVVVRMATIELEAHRARGVRTTLKHFPGIGSSTTNTDFGVADVTKTWTPRELEPFRQLIAAGIADLVMAGHVVNGKLDPDRPASLSGPTVEGVLRGQLGWDGVVVTDDLQAAAITRAVRAGRSGRPRPRGRLRPAPLREPAGLRAGDREARARCGRGGRRRRAAAAEPDRRGIRAGDGAAQPLSGRGRACDSAQSGPDPAATMTAPHPANRIAGTAPSSEDPWRPFASIAACSRTGRSPSSCSASSSAGSATGCTSSRSSS